MHWWLLREISPNLDKNHGWFVFSHLACVSIASTEMASLEIALAVGKLKLGLIVWQMGWFHQQIR